MKDLKLTNRNYKRDLDAACEAFKDRLNEVKTFEFFRTPVRKTGSDRIYDEYLKAINNK